MRRRTLFQPVRGFAGVWMAPRARNPSPCGHATLFAERPAAGREKNAEGPKNTYLYRYTRLPFGEWDVSRRVTQAGMPQGKIINRHPAVLVA